MCFFAAGIPAAIGAITSIIGTGASVVGGLAAAKAEENANEFRQKQETMLAEDALKRGAVEEEKVRRETAALTGRQRAVMAAGNVDIGSGSSLAVLGDTAQLGELDAQTVRNNAQRESSYHQTNATLSGMAAKDARRAGYIGAVGTLAGGASALAEKWYKPAKKPAGAGAW